MEDLRQAVKEKRVRSVTTNRTKKLREGGGEGGGMDFAKKKNVLKR